MLAVGLQGPCAPPKPCQLSLSRRTPQVGSFRRGLKTLPEAIAAKLGGAVRCDWALKGIEKEGDVYK